MGALDRMRIRGFKSIRDQTVELRPLNVLIGANGSGKSNFIGVFRLLNRIVEGELQLFVAQERVDQLLHHGRKVTKEIALELTFERNAYTCRLVPGRGDRLVFAEETPAFHFEFEPRLHARPLGAGHMETRLIEAASEHPEGVDASVVAALRSWQVYHFHDTGESASVKQAGPVNDNARLRRDGANLAAFLYLLRQTEPLHYRNIVDTVRLVAPFFHDFDLRVQSVKPPETVRLEWREVGSEAYFDAHSLSDGTLRFMCLATLLLQPPGLLPDTLLLDEPELGLHPFALAVLADLLKSAAHSTQIVVSTQSAALVDQFDVEDVVVVERREGQSVFVRHDRVGLEGWLENYSLGELWQKNVLGGRPARETRSRAG